MNVAPDRTIILGLQIVLDHRSLSSIGQKILMILIKEALWVGWDWDGKMVIIGRRKSKSTFGDNACIRGWAGGAEGGYHGGGGRIFGIFCTSFAGCVNIL